MATTTFDVSATAQGSNKEEAVSLQGAFQQYRNKRQVSFTVDLPHTTHSERTLLENLDLFNMQYLTIKNSSYDELEILQAKFLRFDSAMAFLQSLGYH